MDGEKTFDLDDLDVEFWKEIVFFEIWHSSGLGGPGGLWMVTEDKKKYYLGFEDLPFNEYELAENLHPMFSQTNKLESGRHRYVIEDNGWQFIHGNPFCTEGAMIRDDIYGAFIEVAKDENLIKEKVKFGYYNLPDIVGLALGTESLERINYIRSVLAQEKLDRLMKEIDEEHERNKFLPEHLIWKPMHVNNMKEERIFGECALIVKRNEERLVVMKLTIVFQPYCIKPMQIDPGRTERYILFEKTYHDFYGPIDFSQNEDKWENQWEIIEENFQTSRHALAFFHWACLSDGDYGMFLSSFSTEEEAKEYALCYANTNSHITGNRNTMIIHLESKEDHQRRVERYEAYQAYRKYYREIIDVIVNYDEYPDFTSGGAPFLKEAILKEVPQITERQLTLFWSDLPVVLEKRTQDVIEMERQKSLKKLLKIKSEDK